MDTWLFILKATTDIIEGLSFVCFFLVLLLVTVYILMQPIAYESQFVIAVDTDNRCCGWH